jgi:hypothetical protein
MNFRKGRFATPAVALGLLTSNSLMSSSLSAEATSPTIGLIRDNSGRPVSFEVEGLSSQVLEYARRSDSAGSAMEDLFAIHVLPADEETLPPAMSGSHSLIGNRLTFVPKYPLRAGVTYRAVLHLNGSRRNRDSSALAITINKDFTVPNDETADAARTTLQQIYPTSDVLPQNHLRFYLQFSDPIERNQVYRNLELLDEADQPIEAAFLEIGEELWDPSGQRLTLLLDPGRVKRGLIPHEELGPVLEEGKQYTLRVKADIRDIRGNSLGTTFEKTFTVGPAIVQVIDVTQWKLTSPLPGTRDPLTVRFPRFLDQGLLQRTLQIVDSSGRPVAGTVEIGDKEQTWKFLSEENWVAGDYHLVIDNVLEDSAGNNVNQPFESEEHKPLTRSSASGQKRLSFSVCDPQSTAARPASVTSVLQSQEVPNRIGRK